MKKKIKKSSTVNQIDAGKAMRELADEAFKIPVAGDLRKGKDEFSDKIIKVFSSLKGTQLSAYLSEITIERKDSSFNISFKIPILSYKETADLQLKNVSERNSIQEQ